MPSIFFEFFQTTLHSLLLCLNIFRWCFLNLPKFTLSAIIFPAEETFIAKLVGVKNPNVKRTHRLEGRNEVFATRATSFLKKDGDLFKVHRPGLLGKANTVSFESVRLPGFFLRQKNKKVHLDNLKSRYICK